MTHLSDILTFESAALVAALGALSAAVAKAWPVVRRLTRFLDDVHGEPARPGQPARPGLMERMASVESRQVAALTRLERLESTTERVRAQTENSHTTNLRDDIDRVAEKVDDLHQQHARPHRKDTRS